MLGPDPEILFSELAKKNPTGLAAFLNIAAAMKQVGIDLEGIDLLLARNEGNSIVVQGLHLTDKELEDRGFTSYGDSWKWIGGSFTSLNIKFNQFDDPNLVHIDLDFGAFGADVVGSVTHISEVLFPGKTNPLAMYTAMTSIWGVRPEYDCELPK